MRPSQNSVQVLPDCSSSSISATCGTLSVESRFRCGWPPYRASLNRATRHFQVTGIPGDWAAELRCSGGAPLSGGTGERVEQRT